MSKVLSFTYIALGLAFVPLGYEGYKIHAIRFKFNMYTGPGYLSALLGIVNIILLIVFFREAKLTQKKSSDKLTKPTNYESSECSLPSEQKMKKLLRGEC